MQPILLLHGAIGAAGQLTPLSELLGAYYKVQTLNFSGHEGAPFSGDEFSIPGFAEEVVRYMDENGLGEIPVFGYSMGGYVALYIAKHYPGRISKIATLATKFEWTEEIAAREVQMLNPEKIEQKLPAFASTLQHRHHPNDWKEVLRRTAEMMTGLGARPALATDDYTSINTPTLLLLGDRDKMVSLAETTEVYKTLPNAQMAMLPGTPHPIEQVDVLLLSIIVNGFFSAVRG